jgi:uncharacterized protein (DUF427 family)
MSKRRIEPSPGQESVWDYPRPPRLEPTEKLIRVRFAGLTLAESRRALRVLETSHPPVYYIPPADVALQHLKPSGRRSHCEYKGTAHYYDLQVGDRRVPSAAWCYPEPTGGFEAMRDHLAFYPALMEACFVDGEKVQAQQGGFYGGWVTSDIVGPFKGAPGTHGW